MGHGGATCRAEPRLVRLLTGIVNGAKVPWRHELALATEEIRIGKSTVVRIDVVPPHTVETWKESVQWMTEWTTSDGTSKARVPQ